MKDKAVRPPEPYNFANNHGEYRVWRERLRACLKVQHAAVPWDYLLDTCVGKRETIITEDDMAGFIYNARIRKSDRPAVGSTLYLVMSQSLKLQFLERLTKAGS